jgi:oxygen-independent coproporphyrinogen-3 oxidase
MTGRRIVPYVVPPRYAVDIDTLEQLELAEWQARLNVLKNRHLQAVSSMRAAAAALSNVLDGHHVSPEVEFTLEANPDDLTKEKIHQLLQTPINRLSIGIQSFRDDDLQWMNRAHTAAQSDYAVKLAQDAGFSNITIDLIYSIPGMSAQAWKENLRAAASLHVDHISAYSLTVEPGTYFGHLEKKGKLKSFPQESSEEQFLLMSEFLGEKGYEHYEVSNFAREGCQSKHNTAYWEGKKYLGIGPSAHSFDGDSRQWNIANNGVYVRSIQKDEVFYERELLDQRTKLNEYIMTGLRTSRGIQLDYIEKAFGIDLINTHAELIQELIHTGKMLQANSQLKLTAQGFLLADRIASEFFIVE